MQDTDITVFIACYNEQAGIIPSIECALAAAKEVGRTCDIVIFDDASKDNSVNVIAEYLRQHPQLPVSLYAAKVNQGLGVNYAEAAFRGRGKYYGFIPGDNVVPKETLVEIFKHIGEADMILPYPTDTSCRGPGRRALSRAFTAIVNALGGHNARYYNGSVVHLRYNVMRWHSNAHGFGFLADLATRLLDTGATYVEVPIVPQERAAGISHALTLQNALSVAHTLVDIGARRLGKLMYHGKYGRKVAELAVYGATARAPGEPAAIAATGGKRHGGAQQVIDP